MAALLGPPADVLGAVLLRRFDRLVFLRADERMVEDAVRVTPPLMGGGDAQRRYIPLSSEGGLSDMLPAPEDVRRRALRLIRIDPVPSGLIRFPDVTGVRVVEVTVCC